MLAVCGTGGGCGANELHSVAPLERFDADAEYAPPGMQVAAALAAALLGGVMGACGNRDLQVGACIVWMGPVFGGLSQASTASVPLPLCKSQEAQRQLTLETKT